MAEVLTERHRAVTVAILNRPQRLNALSPSLAAELREVVNEFAKDDGQKVLILTGAGEKAFSTGADLKTFGSDPGSRRRLPISPEPDIAGVAACEKPVIAAINGIAVGGGVELSLCCDIRLAADDAWFAFPEPTRGFIAGLASVMLPRMMPIGVVLDMMLTGERLSAADAARFGLVQKVLPRGDLMTEAMRKAELMCRHSPSALMGTKKVIRYWRDHLLDEQHRYYEAVVHRVFLSGDMFEGIQAFADKRDPNFSSGWPDPNDTDETS